MAKHAHHIFPLRFLIILLPLTIKAIEKAQFEHQFINEINMVRLKHMNTYVLMREINLTLTAQSYAEMLANSGQAIRKASESELMQCAAAVYSREKPLLGDIATVLCGENLALISNTNSNLTTDACSPGVIVQKLWNSQRLYYNYTFPPSDTNSVLRVQDFTQLVW